MCVTQFGTDPAEFLKFHKLLTAGFPDYRPFYIKLIQGSKTPTCSLHLKSSQRTASEAYGLLKQGFNIGLVAKIDDPLVLIDVDDKEKIKDVPLTLMDVSRSRVGNHYYYLAKDSSAKVNISVDDAGEVRASNYYVVVPGSYVPCKTEEIDSMPESEKPLAGRYTVYNEQPVNKITYSDFPEVFKNVRMAENLKDANAGIKKAGKKHYSYSGKKSAIWELSISSVTGCFDSREHIPMPVLHDSKNGNNASVQFGLLHCYRHKVYHNAFSFLAAASGLMDCEAAGSPKGKTCFGADATDGETVFHVWKYAKERNLIPQDDPIPRSALIFFAKSHGIGLGKNRSLNGNELTDLDYRLTLILLDKEGINHGRQ